MVLRGLVPLVVALLFYYLYMLIHALTFGLIHQAFRPG